MLFIVGLGGLSLHMHWEPMEGHCHLNMYVLQACFPCSSLYKLAGGLPMMMFCSLTFPAVCVPMACQNEGMQNNDNCECVCVSPFFGQFCGELYGVFYACVYGTSQMWVLSIAETIETQLSVLYIRRSIMMQNRQLSPNEYLEAYSPNSVVHLYTAIIIILYIHCSCYSRQCSLYVT